MMKVAVIGAGLSGLAAAARLAGAGLEVTLFEKQAKVGGKAGQITSDGFRFDTGPSLLTMPEIIDQLFADLGYNRQEFITFQPLEVLCRYQFTDGTVLRSLADGEAWSDEVARTTLDPATALTHYLAHSEKLYRLAADFFLFQPLSGWLSFGRGVSPQKGLWALRQLPHLGFGQSMHHLHTRYFRDPRLIQLFDRYATYTGSDPYRCPATLALIPHVEHRLEACVVAGGIYRLVEALEALALRVGVNLQTGTPVEKILLRDRQVQGVRVGEEQIPFDAVVSAIDVNTTYQHLLADSPLQRGQRHRRRELSSSAMVFYWGIRGEFPELDIHNILFSYDYQQEFRELRQGHSPQDPTVYVYRSCAYSPEDTPAGHENWFVMINTPPDQGQDWTRETQAVRDLLSQKLQAAWGVDLSSLLVAEHVLNPPEIARRTGSYCGSLYGPASHGIQASFLRHPNRSPELRGLYFCGGSAHPGGGMALVLLSAALACGELLTEAGRTRP